MPFVKGQGRHLQHLVSINRFTFPQAEPKHAGLPLDQGGHILRVQRQAQILDIQLGIGGNAVDLHTDRMAEFRCCRHGQLHTVQRLLRMIADPETAQDGNAVLVQSIIDDSLCGNIQTDPFLM